MRILNIIRRIVLFFLIMGLQFQLWAQDYAVSAIAPELLENAIAVVREYHTQMEVSPSNNSSVKQKTVITILEPRGLALADIQIARDSFRGVKRIKATLYDQDGNQIRVLGREEIFTRSLHTGYSVYDDIEFLTTDIRTNQFPFTVEYDYEVHATVNYLNHIWTPVSNLEVSVENASLYVITPPSITFRHKEFGEEINAPFITDSERQKRQHFWELGNIKALKSEPYMPRWFRLVPMVVISPNEFTYDKYAGNMQSWEEFGLWIHNLNKGRQRLPRNVGREIKNLMAGVTDTLEIIHRVHQYVQENTRYVSINLGIGGFQPQKASLVLRDQYGDCKALSNLTQALLDHLGIPSFYTLILSGNEYLPVDPDFPHNYFNHAILCVPLAHDTLWLETTVSHFPPGYLGSGNSSRHVLVVTPQGGVLARTPEFVQEESRIAQVIQAELKEEGKVDFYIQKTFSGLNFEDRSGFGMHSPYEQREYLLYATDLKDMKVNDLEYIFDHNPEPRVEKTAYIEAFHFLRRAGNRFLLQPVVMQQEFPAPPLAENRTNSIELGSTGVYNDTIHWSIPPDLIINHLPEDIDLDTPYGAYELTFEYYPNNNTLSVYRRSLLKLGIFGPQHLNDFADFLRKVHQSDNTSIMLTPRISDNQTQVPATKQDTDTF